MCSQARMVSAQCGERMGASFVSREKRRHTYYVCRTGKKREPRCRQQPVASTDLEPSLFEKLEPMFGADRSTILLGPSVERIVYDSRTREVSVSLRDGSRFGYCLPVANRPGVTFEEQVKRGRVARRRSRRRSWPGARVRIRLHSRRGSERACSSRRAGSLRREQ
jgi:hypothetical protein